MTSVSLRQKETLLIEMLLCGLDLRTSAGTVESPMLVYLADLLVMRTREELDMISGAGAGERHEPDTSGDGRAS